jgi:hypothetical protein
VIHVTVQKPLFFASGMTDCTTQAKIMIDQLRAKKQFMETRFADYVSSQSASLDEMLRDCSDLDELLTQAQDFKNAQQNAKIEFLEQYQKLIETELLPLMQDPSNPGHLLKIRLLSIRAESDPALNVADPVLIYFWSSIVGLSANGTSTTSLAKCCNFVKACPRWTPDTACLTRQVKAGINYVSSSRSGLFMYNSFLKSHPPLSDVLSSTTALCLETDQSSSSLMILDNVKKRLQGLSDSANLAAEWSNIFSPLRTPLFPVGNEFEGAEIRNVDTSYHFDVDMVVIGISHPQCKWSDICSFPQDPRSFKFVFQRGRSGANNGFRGKFFQGKTSRPLWTLPQALLAKACFGNLECDLVVFGPEDASKADFEALMLEELRVAVGMAICDPQISDACRSILNHLDLDPVSGSSSSSVVTDLTAVALVLSNLQRRLTPNHHVFLVDLGCKSRSCIAPGGRIETLRSHMNAEDSVPPTNLRNQDFHDSFRYILEQHLNLAAVQRLATFMLADLGVEFSAPGRFLHWHQDACKDFKTAMGGKGSLFLSFGVRQLANFDSRNTEFER